MVAMMTACQPGDRVIVFSPFYENYAADAVLCGAQPMHVALRPPAFQVDFEEVERAFRAGARAIVLCNPSNPCGKVFSREELVALGVLAEKYDAFVITDEVYEHIVYAPRRHVYFAALPGMADRTIVCNSLSKTYSITGWRLGYVQASARVIAEARKVHDFLTIGAAAPIQEAAVVGLEFPESYYEKFLADYTRRRDVFLGYLRASGLPFIEPEGAYYVMTDISELGFPTDTEAAHWLAREVGVAGVPGSSFFHEPVHHLIRFHFAKREATLHVAGEKLTAWRQAPGRA